MFYNKGEKTIQFNINISKYAFVNPPLGLWCIGVEFFYVSLYTKYLYYVCHFLYETWFCISEWHVTISLHLVHYVKIRFKHFASISRNVSKKNCLCDEWLIQLTIFNRIHARSYMNNIHSFQDIWKRNVRVKECGNRQTECISFDGKLRITAKYFS